MPPSLVELNKMLDATTEKLNGVVKEGAKFAKAFDTSNIKSDDLIQFQQNTERVNKALSDLENGEKARISVNNQIAKQRQKQIELASDQAEELAKLRAENQKAAKAQRDAAKAAVESGDAFKVLTKRTNDAMSEYKRLAAQFGVTSKEALDALAVFEELDDELRSINEQARDGRRNVGRYAEALEQVGKSGSLLGGVIESVRQGFTLLSTHPLVAVAVVLSGILITLGRAFVRSEKGARLLAQGAII